MTYRRRLPILRSKVKEIEYQGKKEEEERG